jgi:hypothetical protein
VVSFYHEFKEERFGVILLDVLETAVDLRINLLEEVDCDFVVCDCHEHADVQSSPIGHPLLEGNTEDFAYEEGFFTDAATFPADHELPNESSMVATFFLVEFDLDGLTGELEEGHIEGALSCDKNALSDKVLIISSFGDLEPKCNFPGQIMVLHQDGQEELFELISAEGLEIEEVDDYAKDFLNICELVATDKGMFLEENLNFCWSAPFVLAWLVIDEDVVPGCFEDHLRVLNQFVEQLVFNFAVELIFEDLNEVDHSFYKLYKFFILEYFNLIIF